MVGTKRRVPSVLELLTAQRADALVAEGDKSVTDGETPQAVESSGKVDPGKGGGLAIVAARQATGKGQASDISEKDPERIGVAKNTTNEATIHRCATDGGASGVEGGGAIKNA